MQLGLTPDTRWETDVHTFAEAAQRAGFSTLGIHSGLVGAQAPSAFASKGLGCHELLGIVVSDDGPATMAWAGRLVDEAAAMNARWVSTTFAAPLTDDTAALVARCAAMFAEAGSGMAIESSPLGPVPTIKAGLDMVAVAGVERGDSSSIRGTSRSVTTDGTTWQRSRWSGSRTSNSRTRCPPRRPTEWTRRSIAAPCPETACSNSSGSHPRCGNADSTAWSASRC